MTPRTNVVSRVTHPRPVIVLEEHAANDGASIFRCPSCDTQYFKPQACDWCPDTDAVPQSSSQP